MKFGLRVLGDRGFRPTLCGLSLLATLALALTLPASPGIAAEKLRFAVGPFQPTPGDTKKAYEPFFKYIAGKLGVEYDLVVTNDWAGIATALANGQADVAWMGPWGYVLANNEGGAQAVATVKYGRKAGLSCHHRREARPWQSPNSPRMRRECPSPLPTSRLRRLDALHLQLSTIRTPNIDPKTFFRYRDGASHPANEMAVASGQVDLATDYDRNLSSMIERGLVKRNAVKVVWTSEPLPRPDRGTQGSRSIDREELQEALSAITEEQAKSIMPPHYTGWVPATHATYKLIKDAGTAVGKLKPKAMN